MGQFASDNFSGTEDAELSAYNSAWTKVTGATGNAEIASGKLRASSTTTPAYYHSGTPASADYSVSADVYTPSGGSTSSAGVLGRCSTSAATAYMARHNTNVSSTVELFKLVAGTATQIGSSVTVTTPTAGGAAKRLLLDMAGTTLKVYWDGSGSPSINQTDSAITAAGRPGVRYFSSATPTDTSGLQLDNWSADETGSSAITGTSAQTLDLSGSSAGTVAVAASSASTVALTGSAAGAVVVAGSSAATVDLAGSAAGAVFVAGASAATVTLTGSAAGTTTGAVSGASSAAIDLTGAAAGQVAVQGGSAVVLALDGSATGTVTDAGGVAGQSSVTFAMSGTAAGAVLVRGSSDITLSMSGSATGHADGAPEVLADRSARSRTMDSEDSRPAQVLTARRNNSAGGGSRPRQ